MIPASSKRRFAAFAIDNILFLLIITATVVIVPDKLALSDTHHPNFNTTLLVIITPALLLYLCKDCIEGVSIGRLLAGIVVKDIKNPCVTPGFTQMFTRNLILVTILPVEMFLLAFTNDNKRLGDKITHTTVVQNHSRSMRIVRLGLIFIMLITISSFFLISSNTVIMKSKAYDTALAFVRSNEEIAVQTGGITHTGCFATGNINVSNGIGNAQLNIFVEGKKSNYVYKINMNRTPEGKWTVIKHQAEKE